MVIVQLLPCAASFVTVNSNPKPYIGRNKNQLNFKTKTIFLCIGLAVIIPVILCKGALAEGPSKVLVLPFYIHSEKDLSFLRDGIEDMLSTRLALAETVVLIDREEARQALQDVPTPINEKTAVLLGARLEADYVLFGSLTVSAQASAPMPGLWMSIKRSRW